MDNKTKKLWYLTMLFAFDLAMLILISSFNSANAVYLGCKGERVIKIQEQLYESGYFSGETNGFFGFDTRSALKEFQKSNGINPSGKTDYSTLSAFNISSRTALCFDFRTELLARCIQLSNCSSYPEMLDKGLEILNTVSRADTLGSYADRNFPDLFSNTNEPSDISYSAAMQAIRIFSQQTDGFF